MCDVDWDGRAEVWRDVTRRARQPYTCDACRGSIPAGAHYVAHFSVFDGEPHSERCCLACDHVRLEFADAHDGDPTPSYLGEVLHECLDTEEVSLWRVRLRQMNERYFARLELRGAP